MRTAIITPVSGREVHLHRQLAAFERSHIKPDVHIVVAMNDPAVAEILSSRPATHVEQLSTPGPRLPVAAARNLGADIALGLGAELLVFLDVDCLPTVTMLGRYIDASVRRADGALFCGPVTYLSPPGPRGYQLDCLDSYINPHPARPAPDPGDLIESDEHTLFWSLSFAVQAATWQRIGGFFTGYTGYGGEDTDFAQKAAQRAVPLCWVGGAHALHQYHPVSDPPVEHLDDILTNGAVFYDRWGWWPMQGWLDAFERRGLITMDNGVPHRTRASS